MIMTAVSLLRDKPQPTEDEIRREMQRNVCRCGTYARIIRAVQRAASSGQGAAP
jgi:aerobic-type carbon monoxide dehydrogenase small subunit (CoxS/CutS family)